MSQTSSKVIGKRAHTHTQSSYAHNKHIVESIANVWPLVRRLNTDTMLICMLNSPKTHQRMVNKQTIYKGKEKEGEREQEKEILDGNLIKIRVNDIWH